MTRQIAADTYGKNMTRQEARVAIGNVQGSTVVSTPVQLVRTSKRTCYVQGTDNAPAHRPGLHYEVTSCECSCHFAFVDCDKTYGKGA